ncbi:MAG: Lrp/AsnC ligand binding domain-containing protein [Candidatus Heimdallarchaeota archaeon]|nr:Lrp/AsnC ligand binding domain-containing protein [Candidatus Heimdallarchaeota archaeon]MCK5298183.1 Lrp/AsnC ligand binding domain-containing protein [Candidatus Heimdallarchaeota archaeon]TET32227.1 MAG: Lrp/AsnC family transcriptional regulator [Candidatus Heimdallarchaeota archaeon]
MAKAYVLINSEIGGEQEVVDQLNAMKEVVEVSIVYGVYDVIVKLEADSMEVLKELITSKVRHLNKVRSTMTMIASQE